jgi:hypothetical protein
MRIAVTLVLFLAGLVLGYLAQTVSAAAPPRGAFTSLERVEEPSAAAAVAGAVARDDARALSQLLEEDVLQELAAGIEPLIEVTEVRFTGATQRENRVLAAYVAKGRDNQGGKWAIGFVLRVEGDNVVGVN